MSEYDETALQDEIDRFEREREAPSARSYVKPRPPKDPAQVYSIRIPVDRLEQLRILADRAGKRPTTMMREWVLERLDTELARPGPHHVDWLRPTENSPHEMVNTNLDVVWYDVEPVHSFNVTFGSEAQVVLGSDEEDSELPLPFSVVERLRR